VIYGVFAATCDGGHDLDPAAWGGEFPYQVMVKLCSNEPVEVPRRKVGRIVNDRWRHVAQKLWGETADQLLQYFHTRDEKATDTP